jgi:hypothetical protein
MRVVFGKARGNIFSDLPHAKRTAVEVWITFNVNVTHYLAGILRFFDKHHIVGNRDKPFFATANIFVTRFIDDCRKPHLQIQAGRYQHIGFPENTVK